MASRSAAGRIALLLAALAPQRSDELQLQGAPSGVCRAPLARSSCIVMGRKFENNKLKMAKTALAYAKKASYIGKKVVVAVKAGGEDPGINRQLAAVMAEVSAAPRARAPPRKGGGGYDLRRHVCPCVRGGRRTRSMCPRT